MDTEEINSRAWDKEEERGNWWTRIVGEDEIEKARRGSLYLRITTEKAVPPSWTERIKDKDVLVLCGGGGQQTPLLAAYGCRVTSVDISPHQIGQDRKALEMYGLTAKNVVGSALSLPFSSSSFDAVVNPISLNFIEDINKVYDEVDRVLRKDGYFMMGIANPVLYIFDEKKQKRKLKVKYTLPFSTTKSLSEKEVERKIKAGDTLEFSHTLESIITPLLGRGFVMEDFFSDSALSEPTDSFIHDSFLAFLFRKTR
jgi:ubiquinone/menaquinone biosynthesis C-methylase UbiE